MAKIPLDELRKLPPKERLQYLEKGEKLHNNPRDRRWRYMFQDEYAEQLRKHLSENMKKKIAKYGKEANYEPLRRYWEKRRKEKEEAARKAVEAGRALEEIKPKSAKLRGLPKGTTRAKVREAMAKADKQCELKKGLPPEIAEKLGIETNPARILEQLMRAETTPIRDKIAAARTLIEYTHQKQTTKQEIKAEVTRPEDWLNMVVEGEVVMDERFNEPASLPKVDDTALEKYAALAGGEEEALS